MASLAAHVFTARDWLRGAAADPVSSARGGAVDDTEHWRAVAAAVGVETARLRRAHQVHGAAVVIGRREPGEPLPEADVIVVQEWGEAAAIQVADCVPLLIADRVTGAVSAAHAGWRGLVARAPQVAVETLVRRCGARVTDLLVAVGPSIGPCCYEVGLDVRRSFDEAGFPAGTTADWFHDRPVDRARNPSLPVVVGRGPASGERWFFDMWAAAVHQVTALGVPAAQVFRADLCTASHPEVFCSYRRDGPQAGRVAAAIRCGPRRP